MMPRAGDVTAGDLGYPPTDRNHSDNNNNSTHCSTPNSNIPDDHLFEKLPGSKAECFGSKSGPTRLMGGQYGLQYYLNNFQLTAREPALRLMMLGVEPTDVLFDYDSNDALLDTFGGPMQAHRLRPHEIEANVPNEYRVHANCPPETPLPLPSIDLTTCKEDTLFFLFYMFGGSVTQVAAARELHRREWLFHRRQQVWLMPAGPSRCTNNHSNSNNQTIIVFNPILWRKETKVSYSLRYEQLETDIPDISYPTGF